MINEKQVEPEQNVIDEIKRDTCSRKFSKGPLSELSIEDSMSQIDELNEKIAKRELLTVESSIIDVAEEDDTDIGINGEKVEEIESTHEHVKKEQFEVINQDPMLRPFEGSIKYRIDKFNEALKLLEENEGSLENFSRSYNDMGLWLREGNVIEYKEYAPGAHSLSIFGQFNNWNRDEYHCIKDKYGFWSIKLEPKFNPKTKELEPLIPHNTLLKVHLTLSNGKREDRNPVWIKYLYQNQGNQLFDSVMWTPKQPYVFKNPRPPQPKSVRIYEAHVGMSSNDPKVSTYKEFTNNVLPRIKETGYTVLQLMAIMEHAYYGSFGYHVTNFFAISSRQGTPDELKELIDTAHGMGIVVLMDLIHSHASSNTYDGINLFDGTDYLYFHGGARGYHKLWDSKLFNYKNYETIRFLLSNLAWYIEEYHFDGFRFDGVTSMLYMNHGINYCFTGKLHEYYNENVDIDACVYLMLANELTHRLVPDAITIAEDVSGMPTLCRPIKEGGYGFDFRLNMSVPDKWIELLKEVKDEDWDMGNIVCSLTNRRYNEKHIAYAESHDQSIVGDKTISMWLFNKDIYHKMDLKILPTIIIDRGMALHKLIRLITYALGGEAYLNFIGNEFGHPEWVDFPRVGNGFSKNFCRRRWDLCDNVDLRYRKLHKFDKEMHQLETNVNWLNAKHQYISLVHEKDKLIVFERGDLLFVFNFHPNRSWEHYRIGTWWGSDHVILFHTDELCFDGKERVKRGARFIYKTENWNHRPNYIQLYIPCRVAIVLIAVENIKKYDNLKDLVTVEEEVEEKMIEEPKVAFVSQTKVTTSDVVSAKIEEVELKTEDEPKPQK